MSLIYETRPSDSPFVDTITHGWTISPGSAIRPAECHWHFVIARYNGEAHAVVAGPWSTAGITGWGADAEILWVRFKLGTYMPHLSPGDALDSETSLPIASSRSFWLKGSAWQFPDHENVDTFVNKLAHAEVLMSDPVVTSTLEGQPESLAPRTLRHRFLQATGLTRSRIFQVQRAQQAADMLRQGFSISDTISRLGYFDQPHLTRSLTKWVGQTPARITRSRVPVELAV